MNITVLIPTIRGRENFLQHAKSLIAEQTLQPTNIIVVDDEKMINGYDVAWRYLIGIERCKEIGSDVIIFWEDDDWYKYTYIEFLIKNWVLAGMPDIFGIERTIYYNIVKRRYSMFHHSGRASMMMTMVNGNIAPNWLESHNQYVDMALWKHAKHSHKTMDVPFQRPVAIGIKHGIGDCAGGGHAWPKDKFQYIDTDLKFLSSIIDADSLNFYSDFYNGQK